MNWWRDIALDGIVGGVVGGLATALAVAWTLRGSRRLGEVADCELAVSNMQGACVRAGLTLNVVAGIGWNPFPGRMNDRLIADLGSAIAATFETRGRVFELWPGFTAEVDALLDQVTSEIEQATRATSRLDTLRGKAAIEQLDRFTGRGLRLAKDWIENHEAFEATRAGRRNRARRVGWAGGGIAGALRNDKPRAGLRPPGRRP